MSTYIDNFSWPKSFERSKLWALTCAHVIVVGYPFYFPIERAKDSKILGPRWGSTEQNNASCAFWAHILDAGKRKGIAIIFY